MPHPFSMRESVFQRLCLLLLLPSPPPPPSLPHPPIPPPPPSLPCPCPPLLPHLPVVTFSTSFPPFLLLLLHLLFHSSGQDVGDHPPITPMKNASRHQLSNDMQWRVYELVVTNFLASVSPPSLPPSFPPSLPPSLLPSLLSQLP